MEKPVIIRSAAQGRRIVVRQDLYLLGDGQLVEVADNGLVQEDSELSTWEQHGPKERGNNNKVACTCT